MALVPLRLLLDHAAENGYGIPAFNVNNLEQVQSIMEAAHETDSPVILQASRGARQYAGENFLRHLILAAVETYPDIPVVMHQDHGNSPATCFGAAANGFTSVMMDGSLMADAKSPASYEYNVAVTKEVVDVAHAIGVSVEGELGCLGSLETGDAGEEDGSGAEGKLTHDMMLTDPVQARDFVQQTGVDALAIAIGTSLGASKFTRKPTGEILAIMEAAQETDSPVILQASAGARKYAGEAYLRHMMLAAVETHPDIPVVVHQDHGASPSVCIQSIRSGFTSVMMDGSLMEDAKTPASYDYNVAVTGQVCAMAHAIGVSVEGELGCLGSLETGDAGE